jgi:hypothetical protein
MPESLKDAKNHLTRTNEYVGINKQKSDVIKFKLGSIDFEEMQKQNKIYNPHGFEGEFSIVLTDVDLSRMQTFLMEEGVDSEIARQEIAKFPAKEKSDLFYLYF